MSVFDADRALVRDREPIVRSVGLGPAWDRLLADDDTATRQMLLGLVSALALYLDESGVRLAATT
jgi:hypothetical protein